MGELQTNDYRSFLERAFQIRGTHEAQTKRLGSFYRRIVEKHFAGNPDLFKNLNTELQNQRERYDLNLRGRLDDVVKEGQDDPNIDEIDIDSILVPFKYGNTTREISSSFFKLQEAILLKLEFEFEGSTWSQHRMYELLRSTKKSIRFYHFQYVQNKNVPYKYFYRGTEGELRGSLIQTISMAKKSIPHIDYDFWLFLIDNHDCAEIDDIPFITKELIREYQKWLSKHSNQKGALAKRRIWYSYKLTSDMDLQYFYGLLRDKYGLIDPNTSLKDFEIVFSKKPINEVNPIRWHNSNASQLLYLLLKLQEYWLIEPTNRMSYQVLNKCFVKPTGEEFEVNWRSIKQGVVKGLRSSSGTVVDRLIGDLVCDLTLPFNGNFEFPPF